MLFGDYNLTYNVTDSSGNKASRDFTLHVVEKTNSETKKADDVYIQDVINNYKNENTKIGIDVSKWQGQINWEEVKNAGVEFVIIRIGYQAGYDEECVVDPYFIENIEGAKAQGLDIGIYFYSYAKNTNQATEQAEWVKEQLSGYDISLPIAFDWESWSSFNKTGMSFNTINKVASTFLEVLSNAGYQGMLYSSKNYLVNIWYPTKYKTWLAHYTDKTNYEGSYYIWQMCETGKVSGINGDVDIDIMYI